MRRILTRTDRTRRQRRPFRIEPLEPRVVLSADPVISEFMAENDLTESLELYGHRGRRKPQIKLAGSLGIYGSRDTSSGLDIDDASQEEVHNARAGCGSSCCCSGGSNDRGYPQSVCSAVHACHRGVGSDALAAHRCGCGCWEYFACQFDSLG